MILVIPRPTTLGGVMDVTCNIVLYRCAVKPLITSDVSLQTLRDVSISMRQKDYRQR
jgi:CRISPR/Cas system CMR subunit Cmr4 (Cas7 group RAMP superfamily)